MIGNQYIIRLIGYGTNKNKVNCYHEKDFKYSSFRHKDIKGNKKHLRTRNLAVLTISGTT